MSRLTETSRGLLRLACLSFAALASGCAYMHVPYQPTQEGRFLTVASADGDAFAYRRRLASIHETAARDALSLAGDVGDSAFDYPPEPVYAKNRVETEQETEIYQARHLRFPSIGENGQGDNLVTAHYYQSKLPGRKKLVIVLPIWGSSKYPSTRIAEGVLARSRGATNVLLVHGDRDFIDWKAIEAAQSEQEFVDLAQRYLRERMRTTVIDTRRWLDWAETQADLDPQHIGLIGFSIGAMVGSGALVSDPRIRLGILVIGGGNPDEILATCQWEPEALRNTITRRFGWSVQRYREVLHDILDPVNPARRMADVDPRGVLIFDSYYDSCIPASAREALWQAMGKPERISFLHDHKMSFMSVTPLGLNFMRGRIHAFLDKNL